MTDPHCKTCAGTDWVCEAHADRPWDAGEKSCGCGAPGMPCPACDDPAEERPDLPADFNVTLDDKGPRH
jgi:hypothetical protein